MIALGTPLVVWDDWIICDRCGGDMHITTDGIRVAVSTVLSSTHWPSQDWAERDGTLLTVRCGLPDEDDGNLCGATATVDLSTEFWTTVPKYIQRVVDEGVVIP